MSSKEIFKKNEFKVKLRLLLNSLIKYINSTLPQILHYCVLDDYTNTQIQTKLDYYFYCNILIYLFVAISSRL